MPEIKHPNILFLMSDQHRADVTGYEGNRVVRTPTLDWLAETGVAFRNAYTPSPICVPARQCLASGQLPRTCGAERYGDDLPSGYMTWPRRFSQHAYQTVACGKLHHMGTDQLQGWNRLIGMHENVDEANIADRHEPAFEAIAPLHRDLNWDTVKEVRRAGVGRGRAITHDEYTVQGALHYIEEYFADSYYDKATPDRPIVLKVSLEQPHNPFFTDEARFAYYLNRVEPFHDSLFDHPLLGRFKAGIGEEISEREARRGTAAYYGMVETVDDHFRSIMEALRALGQNLDDWIIIYTSDHGEMLGEHGVWMKTVFFEGSARVPLIIRWPLSFDGGRIVQENVNLCDIFATLCDLCDLPIPTGLDSRSLVPLLQGHGENWDNESISQFKTFGTPNLMIKRDYLKYQYFGEDVPELLFDLQQDPRETSDVVHEPPYEAELITFRQRRDELDFGPNGAFAYVNAGYGRATHH